MLDDALELAARASARKLLVIGHVGLVGRGIDLAEPARERAFEVGRIGAPTEISVGVAPIWRPATTLAKGALHLKRVPRARAQRAPRHRAPVIKSAVWATMFRKKETAMPLLLPAIQAAREVAKQTSDGDTFLFATIQPVGGAADDPVEAPGYFDYALTSRGTLPRTTDVIASDDFGTARLLDQNLGE